MLVFCSWSIYFYRWIYNVAIIIISFFFFFLFFLFFFSTTAESEMLRAAVLTVLMLFHYGHAHTYHNGECPSVQPMPDFDMKRVRNFFSRSFVNYLFYSILESLQFIQNHRPHWTLANRHAYSLALISGR